MQRWNSFSNWFQSRVSHNMTEPTLVLSQTIAKALSFSIRRFHDLRIITSLGLQSRTSYGLNERQLAFEWTCNLLINSKHKTGTTLLKRQKPGEIHDRTSLTNWNVTCRYCATENVLYRVWCVAGSCGSGRRKQGAKTSAEHAIYR